LLFVVWLERAHVFRMPSPSLLYCQWYQQLFYTNKPSRVNRPAFENKYFLSNLIFELKSPITVLLRLYTMEQLWTAEDINSALKDFSEGRSIRHAAELFQVPRTYLSRKIISGGNITKSKGGHIAFIPSAENGLALGTVRSCSPTDFWVNSKMQSLYIVFFFSFLGWVRLSPLGTSANIWLIVPTPDDRWWRVWSSRWNENWQGKSKY
jgi:hypothetical protein